ncbi:RHS repeat domain-containing protein [Flavobacterium branchiophilum]|uniref:RHS repeat domain-containing protein n=1 Tax=Flavobacterium branchiophilum TaxID=55197 RepID=UPI003B84586F
MGRPIQCYDESGNIVWETDYDIYGQLRNLKGDRSFIPFRQLGQYEDIETSLYYNRFRYYNPETGVYISQDPIGLAGNNPNFYGYVFDSNSEVDLFGLEKCMLSNADKAKLKKLYSDDGIINPHDHHIVREKAPPKWSKEYKDYVTKSQDIIKKEGIGVNDDIRNFTRAQNGGGAHTQKAAKYVYEQLSKSENITETLKDLATQMNKGIFY